MANGEKIKNEDLRKTLKKGNGKRILLLQNGVKGLKIAFFWVIQTKTKIYLYINMNCVKHST